MSNSYQMVPLRDVLQQRSEFIEIDDFKAYKRCRVQLHAQGIIERDIVQGIDIKTKKQQVCHTGEFLVAEIDAKVGGFGIVPDNLDGAIVSNHYFLFSVDETVLSRRFLEFFVRTPAFMEQVRAQGTTNYAAIRPGDVLGYKVPLPSPEEQLHIVARIEELAARIEEARGLRREAVEEAEVLVYSSARRLLATVKSELTEVRCWLDENRNGIQTGPFGAQLSKQDFEITGVPVLSIGNIQYYGLELSELKYVSEEKAQSLSRFSIKEGDILFARMGTVGRCCVAPQKAEGWLFNYHIIRVALDKALVDPRYIHWSIRSSKDIENYLGEKIRGATRE